MTDIKVINGALDVITIDGQERFALRGVIDPMSLGNIKVSKYQREILSDAKVKTLMEALLTSRVPDIDLGMRGSSITELGDGVFVLRDDTYVIDGLQRSTAAGRLVRDGSKMPHLGAIIHFDTDEEWERKRFTALNVGQTGLNGSVVLRNFKEDYPGAKLVFSITEDVNFVLKDKVSWGQSMRRQDLITAITFYSVIGRLHSHLGPGKSDPKSLAQSGIAKILKETTSGAFVYNVKTFFKFIDEAYGLKDVAYRKHAVHLKTSFLMALAGLFSDHENFWDGNRLMIPKDIQRKLEAFPLMDPHVRDLAGSAGKALDILQNLMVDHVNSGRRTNRLRRRGWIPEPSGEDEEN